MISCPNFCSIPLKLFKSPLCDANVCAQVGYVRNKIPAALLLVGWIKIARICRGTVLLLQISENRPAIER